MVEIDENTVVLGPGARLKDKRETLSITVEQMAEKLRLDLALLRKIETDSYDKSTPPAFIRGYLRNYAKEVGLDGNEVVSAFNGFLEAADDIQLSAIGSSNRRLIDKKRSRYGKWLVIVVVIGSLGLLGIYLAQVVGNLFDQKDQRATEISLTTDNESPQSASINQQTSSQPIDSTTAKPTTRNNKLRTSIPVNTDKQELAQPVIDTSLIESQPETQRAATGDGSADFISVQIRVTDQAWFEIRDANNQIVETGIQRAGFVNSYQVKAPLFVNIGKPESVSLIIDGNQIDLTGYRPGQPARINYPE